jgi:ketosteroid isomerase-like protein
MIFQRRAGRNRWWIVVLLVSFESLFHSARALAWQIQGTHSSRRFCRSKPSSSTRTTLLSSNNDNLSNSNNNNKLDDPVARLPLLEAELVSETDKEIRQSLLERIKDAKTNAEFGVRKAQFSFYEAFSNQDMEAMANIWSSDPSVRCVHPGMESLNGIEDIMRSWAEIFMQGDAFTIQPSRTRIDISGQTALCSCIEETPGGGQLECLNVYRREGGGWKMILHMASPVMARRRGLE